MGKPSFPLQHVVIWVLMARWLHLHFPACAALLLLPHAQPLQLTSTQDAHVAAGNSGSLLLSRLLSMWGCWGAGVLEDRGWENLLLSPLLTVLPARPTSFALGFFFLFKL